MLPAHYAVRRVKEKSPLPQTFLLHKSVDETVKRGRKEGERGGGSHYFFLFKLWGGEKIADQGYVAHREGSIHTSLLIAHYDHSRSVRKKKKKEKGEKEGK